MIQKKVLLITVRSDTGGGPKHVYDLASNIQNTQIYIASPMTAPYGALYKKVASSHFEIEHRNFSFKKLISLIKFCKEKNIHTIHSHGRGAGIYSRLMSIFGFDIIHTFHGVHFPKSYKERFILFLERFLGLLTKSFISVSNEESCIALKLGLAKKEQISVIPNGIDLKRFSKFKSSKKNKVLGTLTRLDPHKNNLELINFIKKLNGYKLLIAGDGQQRKEIEKHIESEKLEDKVKLLGSVNNVPEFLSSIDTFVTASVGEGLPYAVLEAMAAKRRIVASRVSGHIDLLQEDNLYKLGDFESFKDKLLSAGSSFDMKDYDIQEMVKRISLFY